jgi:hypothetical protein
LEDAQLSEYALGIRAPLKRFWDVATISFSNERKRFWDVATISFSNERKRFWDVATISFSNRLQVVVGQAFAPLKVRPIHIKVEVNHLVQLPSD